MIARAASALAASAAERMMMTMALDLACLS